MNCIVCGKEFELGNRKRFCSPECYHGYRKTYKSKYSHEKYLARKKKKFACMMCGLNRCDGKYQICEQCKQTDVYQSYGYWQPCSIHS